VRGRPAELLEGALRGDRGGPRPAAPRPGGRRPRF
ncbi:MAG: hypothetical protein AVDCRST_MAG30-2385, partial [uncultured Solirubrobacteraceae bacterium]